MNICMRTRIAILGPTILCLSLLPLTRAGAKDPISGWVDSFGYGYEVKVSINNTPVDVIKGKGQQATRLFSADHPSKMKASPEQQNLFILKEGENTISIEFKRLEDQTTALNIKVEVPNRYTKPLFHLESATSKSGKLVRTFRIERQMPKNFKTLEVTDNDLK